MTSKGQQMQVILLERIAKLGQMGEIVKVKNGYARNFLLPQKKALRANEANQLVFEAQRGVLETRNLERKSEAENLADTLKDKVFVAVRSAGETGHLYGSVSSRDIADILINGGYNISRTQITLAHPLKMIGLHPVAVALHAEVEVSIIVNIARSLEEASRQTAGEKLTSVEAIYGLEKSDAPNLDTDEDEDLTAE